MTLSTNDPRLTAYALNELQGPELEAFAAELALDPRAQAEVAAIRDASALIERELAQPSGMQLSAEQLERITSALNEINASHPEASHPEASHSEAPHPEAPSPDTRKPRRRLPWGVLALAATLPLFAAGALLQFGGRNAPELAHSLREVEPASGNSLPGPVELSPEVSPGLEPLEFAPMPRAALGQERLEEIPASPARGERYERYEDSPFVRVESDPRSTFSIDVDTASYALVRRFLTQGQRPPKGAVRIEELVNYFAYSYSEPRGPEPFSVVADVASAPWARNHRLVRIGLKARSVSQAARQPANLVFLIDVSGSMIDANKLPLVKEGLSLLARQLDARDHVSIVVYAGASGVVLPPTSGRDKGEILEALERLQAGGSTNGGQGIQLAYSLAERNFVRGGVNRVILATDGDFNVGITNQNDLVDLIQKKARGGVFLSVLGFGQGNYQDSLLEKLADKGNGNYAYIDELAEARKVLVRQASGTLITVAKDVKIQLEFNPRTVEAFRLVGYENRVLEHHDFHDDRKDAGEIGADHTVTALYEVVPVGGRVPNGPSDELRYQTPGPSPIDAGGPSGASDELLHIKLRYKLPNEDTSRLLELPVKNVEQRLSGDFRFAAAVAEFGMLLRESPHRGNASYANVIELAESSLGQGEERETRSEFVELVHKARALAASEQP